MISFSIRILSAFHLSSGGKREKDRESGTGQPIKSIPAKGGSGVGNWGSNAEEIADGIKAVKGDDGANQRKPPNNFGDLNDRSHENRNQSQEVKEESYEEWAKKNGLKEVKPHHNRTVKSTFKRKPKRNKHEAEADLMFGPVTKKKKGKKKGKPKKQKVLVHTDIYFGAPEKGSEYVFHCTHYLH